MAEMITKLIFALKETSVQNFDKAGESRTLLLLLKLPLPYKFLFITNIS